MMGWIINVYQQLNGGDSPALFGAARGGHIAKWKEGMFGLDWVDALIA